MNEEKKAPQGKEVSQETEEPAPIKTAPADEQSITDDVQAYGEPTDSSGGGK